LQTLYALYEHKDAQYGRIHNRRKLCQLVMTITVAMLLEQGIDVGEVLGDIPNSPISKWGKADWDGFIEFLLSTVNDLLRQDADTAVSEGENEESDEVRNKDGGFSNRLDTLLKTVHVLRGISPLQESLVTLLSPECKLPGDGILPIDQKRMKDFL
jgi:hypothetical protein